MWCGQSKRANRQVIKSGKVPKALNGRCLHRRRIILLRRRRRSVRFSGSLNQSDEQVAVTRRRIRKTVALLFFMAGLMFFGAIVRLWLL